MKTSAVLIAVLAAGAPGVAIAGEPGKDSEKSPGPAAPPAEPARGRAPQRVHDPSTIVRCKEEHWLFSTGIGILSWRSKDLASWTAGPRVFPAIPKWVSEFLPGHRGHFWAPDVIPLKGRYLLYYSVSTWGKNTSAIALASAPTLDPADHLFRWSDEGIVIRSSPSDGFNAIDPSVCLDADGRLWLAFGSFWTGIQLVELDPATGKRLAPDSPIRALASHKEIEAPCLVAREGWHYLFVNWGLCCRGVNSTYRIRVGRSRQIAGPYLDREGRDLRDSGGSPFLDAEDRFIGPGHAAVFREGEKEWISYHFYDRDRAGSATLAVRQLRWDADGWPAAGPFVSPPPPAAPEKKSDGPAK